MRNILHAGVHKAASTWFRDLLRHPIICGYLNNPQYLHYEVDLKKKIYENYCFPTSVIFPSNSIITNIYCDYRTFSTLCSGDYKGFYCFRDPRDMIVSMYYSWKSNHPSGHHNRLILKSKSVTDGMNWVIDEVDTRLGIFSAMKTWMECEDQHIWLIKYEDFFDANTEKSNLANLLRHLGIGLDTMSLDYLYDQFKFESLSNGRGRGLVNNSSHFRRGLPGAYLTDMPEDSLDYFYSRAGDLLGILGYEE